MRGGFGWLEAAPSGGGWRGSIGRSEMRPGRMNGVSGAVPLTKLAFSAGGILPSCAKMQTCYPLPRAGLRGTIAHVRGVPQQAGLSASPGLKTLSRRRRSSNTLPRQGHAGAQSQRPLPCPDSTKDKHPHASSVPATEIVALEHENGPDEPGFCAKI